MLLGMPPYFSTNFLVILNLSLFPLTFYSWSFCSKVSWLTFFSKKVRSGCRASARRVAEGRARAFRDQSNAMLALSPKREYKSVALAFSVFPKQRQRKGNICSVGCLPVHAIKTAHRAFVWLKGRCSASFVLAPALGLLHPLSWQKEQCNNARDSHGNHAEPVSYTHLRAHETRHDLVCRLLLEKKKTHLRSHETRGRRNHSLASCTG